MPDVFAGYDNGCLLYGKDRLLKFWGQSMIKNTQKHVATGSQMSAPPAGSDYAQWDVPAGLTEDVRIANEAIFGKNTNTLAMEKFRICW